MVEIPFKRTSRVHFRFWRLKVCLIGQMALARDPVQDPSDASDQNLDYMFKLLIIGNSSVGKTSFLFRYVDNSFTSAFVSTVGIDFKVKTIYRSNIGVKLQIWVRPAFQKEELKRKQTNRKRSL